MHVTADCTAQLPDGVPTKKDGVQVCHTVGLRLCDGPACVLRRFSANISALQSKVKALPDAAWSREYQAQHNAVLTGRTQNMDRSAIPCLVSRYPASAAASAVVVLSASVSTRTF